MIIEGSLLFQLDSGNDSVETLIPLIESPHFFIIKRNQRKENDAKRYDELPITPLSEEMRHASKFGQDCNTIQNRIVEIAV